MIYTKAFIALLQFHNRQMAATVEFLCVIMHLPYTSSGTETLHTRMYVITDLL